MTQDVTTTGECSKCREYKEVTWTNDPYTAEIYPENDNPNEWWCDDCRQERAWDI